MIHNPPVSKIGIEGRTVPPEGLRFIGPLAYDFTQQNPVSVDLRAAMEHDNLMSFAISAYIDSGANPDTITLTIGFQQIVVQGYTQGWYPIVSQRPIQFTIQNAAAIGTTVLFFANFFIPAFQWPTR